MKKILIIVNIKYSKSPINFAVWNALKVHINLMKSIGLIPVFYTKNDESLDFIKTQYPKSSIFKYTNALSLLKIASKNNKDVPLIWTPDILSVWESILLKIFLRKKIIFWVQGILPEESYMRHNNRFRFILLSLFEKYALKFADKYIFVSDTMKVFYEEKYNLNFENYIVIPCISELRYNPNIKKIRNSFVYIGGLSAWQCFDEILIIFRQIQEFIPDATFHIITPDEQVAKEKVLKILEKIDNLQIYQIKDRSLLSDVLSLFEYGFLIRKDHPTNRVASPIKFAEYLSCGINLIMTDSIPHFSELVIKNNLGIVLDNSLLVDKYSFLNRKIANTLPIYHKYFDFEQQSLKYLNI
ncbi:glycosyltransferase family protein [Dysgonomonas reticulitermitis]